MNEDNKEGAWWRDSRGGRTPRNGFAIEVLKFNKDYVRPVIIGGRVEQAWQCDAFKMI